MVLSGSQRHLALTHSTAGHCSHKSLLLTPSVGHQLEVSWKFKHYIPPPTHVSVFDGHRKIHLKSLSALATWLKDSNARIVFKGGMGFVFLLFVRWWCSLQQVPPLPEIWHRDSGRPNTCASSPACVRCLQTAVRCSSSPRSSPRHGPASPRARSAPDSPSALHSSRCLPPSAGCCYL